MRYDLHTPGSNQSSLLNRSQSVREGVTDKHNQWSDSGPIKRMIRLEKMIGKTHFKFCVLLQLIIGCSLLFKDWSSNPSRNVKVWSCLPELDRSSLLFTCHANASAVIFDWARVCSLCCKATQDYWELRYTTSAHKTTMHTILTKGKSLSRVTLYLKTGQWPFALTSLNSS